MHVTGAEQLVARTIVVPGEGRVTVEPDVALVRLGVLLVRETAADARAAAAELMTAVLDALAAAGVERREVRTTLLGLAPVTDYSPETGPRVTGYQAANSVTVKVRELSSTGALIDAALAAGATSLEGLEFELDDPREAADVARRAAVADARRRAETLADAAGVTVGDVLSAIEGGPPVRPLLNGGMRAVAFSSEAADTPVASGTHEIVVSVSVTFALA